MIQNFSNAQEDMVIELLYKWSIIIDNDLSNNKIQNNTTTDTNY